MGKAARGFMGQAPQSDDLTMLAIHYTPGRKQMGTDKETE
jgi:hypothetical protein